VTLKNSMLVRGALLATISATLCFSSAFAANEFVIHTFHHTALPMVNGCTPIGNPVSYPPTLVLYGAANCGIFNEGVIFQLTPPVSPSKAWTETVIYAFTGGADGGSPQGSLIFDFAGNLYGTTSAGGAFDKGTVFELSPPTGSSTDWTESVLYSFQGGTADGQLPLSSVVWGPSQEVLQESLPGALYGVTAEGGIVDGGLCRQGCGTVYTLIPPLTAGGAWTEKVIHSFTGGSGARPIGGPAHDSSGYLYGTTTGGGKFGQGTIFRLTPPTPDGTWAFRILHAFSGPDGSSPAGRIIVYGHLFYGITQSGGVGGPCPQGCGTVFRLDPPEVPGGTWPLEVLHSFTGGSDGIFPLPDLARYECCRLLGATSAGGGAGSFECSGFAKGCGVAFELTLPAHTGDPWTEVILNTFPNSANDAFEPAGGLAGSGHGVFYGNTTLGAGANGQGAVYGVIPQ
jgi:uncharacterized repeat protein (TIGR03803 family)